MLSIDIGTSHVKTGYEYNYIMLMLSINIAHVSDRITNGSCQITLLLRDRETCCGGDSVGSQQG